MNGDEGAPPPRHETGSLPVVEQIGPALTGACDDADEVPPTKAMEPGGVG